MCVRAGVCVRARSARPAQTGKGAVQGGRDAERAERKGREEERGVRGAPYEMGWMEVVPQ